MHAKLDDLLDQEDFVGLDSRPDIERAILFWRIAQLRVQIAAEANDPSVGEWSQELLTILGDGIRKLEAILGGPTMQH